MRISKRKTQNNLPLLVSLSFAALFIGTTPVRADDYWMDYKLDKDPPASQVDAGGALSARDFDPTVQQNRRLSSDAGEDASAARTVRRSLPLPQFMSEVDNDYPTHVNGPQVRDWPARPRQSMQSQSAMQAPPAMQRQPRMQTQMQAQLAQGRRADYFAPNGQNFDPDRRALNPGFGQGANGAPGMTGFAGRNANPAFRNSGPDAVLGAFNNRPNPSAASNNADPSIRKPDKYADNPQVDADGVRHFANGRHFDLSQTSLEDAIASTNASTLGGKPKPKFPDGPNAFANNPNLGNGFGNNNGNGPPRRPRDSGYGTAQMQPFNRNQYGYQPQQSFGYQQQAFGYQPGFQQPNQWMGNQQQFPRQFRNQMVRNQMMPPNMDMNADYPPQAYRNFPNRRQWND